MKSFSFSQFLSLFASVFWERGMPALSADDWREALRLAREQSVVGLLYEAALRTMGKTRPPRDVLMELYVHIVRVEQMNEAMSGRIADLFAVYEELGADPVLLKGHGVAANWPHPEWRSPGDIDVYLSRNFGEVDRWARVEGTHVSPYDPQVDKHVEFHWRGINVENHFRLSMFYHRRINRRLQAIFSEGMVVEPFLSFIVAGREVRLLPPTVGLLHLLVHLANHLVNEGVGLRQVCDIVMYMHRNQSRIDVVRMDGWLDALRLRRLTDALSTVAVDSLGLPSDEVSFRWQHDPRRAAVLLSLVAESGNYGRNFVAGRLERRFSRLRKLRLLVGRSLRVHCLLPDELRAAWFGKTVNALRLLCRLWRRDSFIYPD